jgi:hypothetical protein
MAHQGAQSRFPNQEGTMRALGIKLLLLFAPSGFSLTSTDRQCLMALLKPWP